MSYLVLCFTIKPLLWEDPKIFFSRCLWSVKENCKFTLFWANNSSVWKINFKVLLYQDAFYSMLCWCHITRMQVIKDIFTLSSFPCIRQSVGLLFKDKGLQKKKIKKPISAQGFTHSKDLSAKRRNLYLKQTVGYCWRTWIYSQLYPTPQTHTLFLQRAFLPTDKSH